MELIILFIQSGGNPDCLVTEKCKLPTQIIQLCSLKQMPLYCIMTDDAICSTEQTRWHMMTVSTSQQLFTHLKRLFVYCVLESTITFTFCGPDTKRSTTADAAAAAKRRGSSSCRRLTPYRPPAVTSLPTGLQIPHSIPRECC